MEDILEYKFFYKDNFGNITEMNKVIDAGATLMCVTEFESHVEKFKLFLLACGYSSNTVDKIDNHE